MKSLSIFTSITAAIVTVILLKMLSFFHFIKWSPVGFSKMFELFSKSNVYVKWGLLLIVTWVLCVALYYLSILFIKIPVSISSLVLGVILALVMEFIILDADSLEKTIEKISIPFICIVVIMTRFIMESAIFHAQDNPLGK